MNESSSSAETSNFVPSCTLLLSSPKFMPFMRTSDKKPNFVAPNIVVIGELVHSSVVSAAEKCFRLLQSFASQNPLLKKVLSLPNEFHSFYNQVNTSLLCVELANNFKKKRKRNHCYVHRAAITFATPFHYKVRTFTLAETHSEWNKILIKLNLSYK